MICKLKNIFPIQSKNLELVVLSDDYKEWYLGNLEKDYFSQYLNTKYNPSAKIKVCNYIQSIIDKPVEETQEIRAVLLKDLIPIGGCTLSTCNFGIEIAYFIEPAHQNMGNAYRMLKLLLSKLGNIEVFAKIQEYNKASIKLVSKIGFKEYTREQGPVCTDIIYKWQHHSIQLKKYENICMLHNGNRRFATCTFSEKILECIPVYTSAQGKDIQIIRFKSDEIVILANRNYYNIVKRYDEAKKTNLLEIVTTYALLSEQYGDNIKKDICMCYWFGFTQITHMIKNNELGEYSENRIQLLEHELVSKENIKNTPNKEDFIRSIKTVGVIEGV